MAEYSRLATGSFISTGAAKAINLPFVPTAVKVWNYSSYATPAANGVPRGYWNANMGQGFAAIDVFSTDSDVTPVIMTGDVITSNGISTFSAGLSLQYGAQQQIIGATAADPIVFNVTAHGYSVGDIVVFEGLYQSSTTGMPQISGMPFKISAVGDANHFSVIWAGGGSNYTALSGSPTGAYVKKVLYPFLYAPGVSFIKAITTGTTTTVLTTAPHNFVVGQEIAFAIPTSWGTTQLNQLPNATIPGSPQNYYVIAVNSATSFTCNANTTSATAFTANQTVAAVKAGLSFPQVFAVGDVNTGGVQISAGSALYPPPVVNSANTINGPAIQGAFVNNTSAGFVIGAGVGATYTSATLIGLTTNVLYWEATLFDYGP